MSNQLKRIITGIIGIPVLILIFYYGGIYFFIFSLLVTSLALWELFSMFEKKSFYPLKISGILLSSLLQLIFYFYFREVFVLLILIFLILISAEVFRKEKINPLNPVIVLFGLVYITIPFILLGSMSEYSKLNPVIYIFVLIWTCDSAAYFGGKYTGRHKLSSISPNKTIEGSVIGFLFTVIVSIVIHLIFPSDLNLRDAIVIGILVGVFSQIGDLFESLIKRYCGVKDSSGIIPGHGGILDRFDSVIFVAPLVFIYFKYFS